MIFFDFSKEKLIIIINKVYKTTNVIDLKNVISVLLCECAKISNLEYLVYLVSGSIQYSF